MRKLTATTLAATSLLTLGAGAAFAAAPAHPAKDSRADRTQLSRDRGTTHAERAHAERVHRDTDRGR